MTSQADLYSEFRWALQARRLYSILLTHTQERQNTFATLNNQDETHNKGRTIVLANSFQQGQVELALSKSLLRPLGT